VFDNTRDESPVASSAYLKESIGDLCPEQRAFRDEGTQ